MIHFVTNVDLFCIRQLKANFNEIWIENIAFLIKEHAFENVVYHFLAIFVGDKCVGWIIGSTNYWTQGRHSSSVLLAMNVETRYTGGRLNIKMPSYQYSDSHYRANTVFAQPSYLYNGNLHTWKDAYIYIYIHIYIYILNMYTVSGFSIISHGIYHYHQWRYDVISSLIFYHYNIVNGYINTHIIVWCNDRC